MNPETLDAVEALWNDAALTLDEDAYLALVLLMDPDRSIETALADRAAAAGGRTARQPAGRAARPRGCPPGYHGRARYGNRPRHTESASGLTAALDTLPGELARIVCGTFHPDLDVHRRCMTLAGYAPEDVDSYDDTGCGRALVWTLAYRCVDCGRFFHSTCIRRHFQKATEPPY